MRAFLESDTGFYVSVGVFTIAVFAIGLAILLTTNPDLVGQRELVGFVGGFVLFMLVFFASMSIQRLEGGDGS